MTFGRTLLAAAVAAAGLGAMAAPAAAETFLALTGDRTILVVERTKKRVVRQFQVAGSALVGIDYRPADGQLYGVRTNGQVVTINIANGTAALKSTLSQRLPSGVKGAIDFNPVVDRLRMVGSDGTNLRANVDDGSVLEDTDISYLAPNPFGGNKPSTLAVAYANSRAGTKTTLLYNIDGPTKALYLQLPANDGVLVPVGQLGVNVAPSVGFDIALDGKSINRGWLLSQGRLWQLDLAGGRVSNAQPIAGLGSSVRDVAVVPGS